MSTTPDFYPVVAHSDTSKYTAASTILQNTGLEVFRPKPCLILRITTGLKVVSGAHHFKIRPKIREGIQLTRLRVHPRLM